MGTGIGFLAKNFSNHWYNRIFDMVQVNHWITKRVEKGWLRIFFYVVNDTSLPMKGHVLLELRWLFGAVYNIDVPLVKTFERGQKGFFYIDVPEKSANRWTRFEWVWVDGDKKYQGKGMKVDKFENEV